MEPKVIIKRVNSSGIEENVLGISVNKGAKGKKELMVEDSITLPFSLSNAVYLKVGDKVVDSRFGWYELMKDYKPKYNEKTGAYDYNLKLDAYYYKWNNKIFKYNPEIGGSELSWKVTDTLANIMAVYLKNLEVLGYTYNGQEFKVEIDDSVDKSVKFLSFDNVFLVDALTMMAETWGCEWWVLDDVIHFGKCYRQTSSEFEIGVNVENMTPSESSSEFGTRLYVFGSTRNIPANYRKIDSSTIVNGIVQKRLMLPAGTPYIDSKEGLTEEEAVEFVKVFEGVYPRTESTITNVKSYEKIIESEEGDVIKKFYCFCDSSLNFSKEYILPGQELKVVFTSGTLNGMTFSLEFLPNGQPLAGLENVQVFEIIMNEDYGRELPAGSLVPNIGDSYVLYNWDSTKIEELNLIEKAEAELLEEGKKFIESLKVDPNTYTSVMFTSKAKELYDGNISSLLGVGDSVRLKNQVLFEGGYRESRIIGYEINLDIPYDKPVYTIGEKPKYSKIKSVEDAVESLVYENREFQQLGSGSSVYVVKRNDSTPFSDSNVMSSLRSRQEFIKKNEKDSVKEEITFEKGIIAELVSYLEQIITNRISSSVFSEGFAGQGWQIWQDEKGKSKLSIDYLTVRQFFSVYELIIQKDRSVNGGLIISPANGKIRSVEEIGNNYAITFEDGNPYQEGDYIRCQVFTGAQKFYWVQLDSVEGDVAVISKEKFTTGVPEVGDETALCGSSNENRQGVVYISSVENGKPKVEVLGGVSSASFEGCLRLCAGYIGDITDEVFGDNQPQGYGLYSDNAYLKGEFILAKNGKSVDTMFAIQDGQIKSSISQTQAEAIKGKTLLYNASFIKGLDGWQTSNEYEMYVGDDNILVNELSVLQQSLTITNNAQFDDVYCLMISNGWIKQQNFLFINKPNFEADKEYPLYFSANIHCLTAGRLIVKVGDKTIYNSELTPTEGFVSIDVDGLSWDGLGDFYLSFSGLAEFYGLTIYTEKNEVLHKTLFEQTDRLLSLTAAIYDKDKEKLQESGLVIMPESAGLFTKDENGNVATIGTYEGGVVKLSGSEIRLEGDISANGNVHIDAETGTLTAKNGVFTGKITSESGNIGGFEISSNELFAEKKTSDEDYYNMSLSADHIHFEKYEYFDLSYGSSTNIKEIEIHARLGNNTLPATTGDFVCPLKIDIESNYAAKTNIAAYINVSGAEAYDNLVMTGNHALYIPKGDICGLRLRTRRIDADTTLSVMDSIILVTSACNITLPENAEDGQIYIFKRMGGQLTYIILPQGDDKIWGYTSVAESIEVTSSVSIILHYDKINKYWCGGFLSHFT